MVFDLLSPSLLDLEPEVVPVAVRSALALHLSGHAWNLWLPARKDMCVDAFNNGSCFLNSQMVEAAAVCKAVVGGGGEEEVLESCGRGDGSPRNASCRCELQMPNCDHVGSTAVVVVVAPDWIVVANYDDSRAVLCQKGISVPLSLDHKPDRPNELQRIEAVGGRVIYWDGVRVLGVLAMSRAISKGFLRLTHLVLCSRIRDSTRSPVVVFGSNWRWVPEAVRDVGAGGDDDGEERGGRVPNLGERRAVGRVDQRDGLLRRDDVLGGQHTGHRG